MGRFSAFGTARRVLAPPCLTTRTHSAPEHGWAPCNCLVDSRMHSVVGHAWHLSPAGGGGGFRAQERAGMHRPPRMPTLVWRHVLPYTTDGNPEGTVREQAYLKLRWDLAQ